MLESALGLLRQGHQLPAGDRPAQGLLPDRGAGRPAGRSARRSRASCSRWIEALEPTPPGLPGPARRAGRTTPPWQALDPAQRRQRTLDAVKRLLLRESQVQPLLLVFEDLHWIDTETQALLDSLVESLPTARMLLLVNYRPEYQHGWGSKTYYSQLRLDPLPPESAEELLDALLGRRPGARAAQAAADRAHRGEPVLPGGERPDAGGDRRRWSGSAAPIGWRSRSRPSRCRPRCRRCWRRASTACRPRTSACCSPPPSSARTCRSPLLQAIAELPDEALRRGLARLQAAEFLYETRPVPGAGVHLQARAHARGHLREPAAGAAPRASRADRGGYRDSPPGSPRGARRAACPPRRSGRVVGQGGRRTCGRLGGKRSARSANRMPRTISSRR